jgi:molybdenum cofactor biosynthesis protein B
MSDAVVEHKAAASKSLGVAVLTVSDTRSLDDDASGALIVELLESAGHEIRSRMIVKDEPTQIDAYIGEVMADSSVMALLVTGGTGVSRRDRTVETLESRFTKSIPGYGELFRWLSYQEIGPACILSRATGGLVDSLVVLLMPGSRAAVRTAMEKIILPELPHLVREARK